jgi:hypothetical protein
MYDKVPEDVYYSQVWVLRIGEEVPCLTKYKKIISGTALAKFRFCFFIQNKSLKYILCFLQCVRVPGSESYQDPENETLF